MRVTELGKSGLTWNWSKAPFDTDIIVGKNEIISSLFQLNTQRIHQRARELNAEIRYFQNPSEKIIIRFVAPKPKQ